MRHDPVVKRYLRYLIIAEQIAEHVRCIHIHQRIHVLLKFQEIRVLI